MGRSSHLDAHNTLISVYDSDGDGLPNVVEWYLGTNPGPADRWAESLMPAELIDLPAPRNLWDPWSDIRNRRFWTIQAALVPEETSRAY